MKHRPTTAVVASAAFAMIASMAVSGGTPALASQPSVPAPSPSAMVNDVPSTATPAVNGVVKAVIPGPDDNSVYIGGDFTQVGSTPAQDLALVNLTTGAVVTSWHPPTFNFGFVFGGDVASPRSAEA